MTILICSFSCPPPPPPLPLCPLSTRIFFSVCRFGCNGHVCSWLQHLTLVLFIYLRDVLLLHRVRLCIITSRTFSNPAPSPAFAPLVIRYDMIRYDRVSPSLLA